MNMGKNVNRKSVKIFYACDSRKFLFKNTIIFFFKFFPLQIRYYNYHKSIYFLHKSILPRFFPKIF